MLEQFSREWLVLHPQTRLLAASCDDLAGDKRRAFAARVAINDWDARLPVSPEVEAAYIERECEQVRAMLATAKGGQRPTVKRLEKTLLSAQEALKKLGPPRRRGHHVGGDRHRLRRDRRAHSYSNLRTQSNIRDAAIDGSARASELHLKTEYLWRDPGGSVRCL
jgi:N12 class adenine-specific DNA methylase